LRRSHEGRGVRIISESIIIYNIIYTLRVPPPYILLYSHTLFIRSWYGRYHRRRCGRVGRGGVTGSAQTAAAESRLMPSIVCARVSPQSRKSAHPPVGRSHRVFIFLRLLLSHPQSLSLPLPHTLFTPSEVRANAKATAGRTAAALLLNSGYVRVRELPTPAGTKRHTRTRRNVYYYIISLYLFERYEHNIIVIVVVMCIHAECTYRSSVWPNREDRSMFKIQYIHDEYIIIYRHLYSSVQK